MDLALATILVPWQEFVRIAMWQSVTMNAMELTHAVVDTGVLYYLCVNSITNRFNFQIEKEKSRRVAAF